jgi:hypothetical protein
MKVLRHFPIMPRLQQLFKTPTMFKLMSWHSQNNSLDGLMSHPCDSKAWKHIHQKFPNFATNPRNVHLVLATNGVNLVYLANHIVKLQCTSLLLPHLA